MDCIDTTEAVGETQGPEEMPDIEPKLGNADSDSTTIEIKQDKSGVVSRIGKSENVCNDEIYTSDTALDTSSSFPSSVDKFVIEDTVVSCPGMELDRTEARTENKSEECSKGSQQVQDAGASDSSVINAQKVTEEDAPERKESGDNVPLADLIAKEEKGKKARKSKSKKSALKYAKKRIEKMQECGKGDCRKSANTESVREDTDKRYSQTSEHPRNMSDRDLKMAESGLSCGMKDLAETQEGKTSDCAKDFESLNKVLAESSENVSEGPDDRNNNAEVLWVHDVGMEKPSLATDARRSGGENVEHSVQEQRSESNDTKDDDGQTCHLNVAGETDRKKGNSHSEGAVSETSQSGENILMPHVACLTPEEHSIAPGTLLSGRITPVVVSEVISPWFFFVNQVGAKLEELTEKIWYVEITGFSMTCFCLLVVSGCLQYLTYKSLKITRCN